jgi:hypothetical protein
MAVLVTPPIFPRGRPTEEKFQSSLLYMGSTNQGGKAVSDCVSVDVDARFLQSCEGHAACSGTYNQRPTTSLTDVRFSYDRWRSSSFLVNQQLMEAVAIKKVIETDIYRKFRIYPTR